MAYKEFAPYIDNVTVVPRKQIGELADPENGGIAKYAAMENSVFSVGDHHAVLIPPVLSSFPEPKHKVLWSLKHDGKNFLQADTYYWSELIKNSEYMRRYGEFVERVHEILPELLVFSQYGFVPRWAHKDLPYDLQNIFHRQGAQSLPEYHTHLLYPADKGDLSEVAGVRKLDSGSQGDLTLWSLFLDRMASLSVRDFETEIRKLGGTRGTYFQPLMPEGKVAVDRPVLGFNSLPDALNEWFELLQQIPGSRWKDHSIATVEFLREHDESIEANFRPTVPKMAIVPTASFIHLSPEQKAFGGIPENSGSWFIDPFSHCNPSWGLGDPVIFQNPKNQS